MSTTPVAQRTRRAILLAAIRVLAANHSASTAEIAAEAGVARSTVHRYYPDRATLVSALHQFVGGEYARAIEAARLDEGTAREALVRLATELVDHLDVFGWWMNELALDPETGDAAVASPEGQVCDEDLHRVVARGREDGSLDPRLPAEWVTMLLWSMLYSVQGLQSVTAYSHGEARSLLILSLDKAVAAT